MNTKILIFTKKKIAKNSSQVLFAIQDKQLPVISLSNKNLTDIIRKHSFKRHEEFDYHINKNSTQFILLEWENTAQAEMFPEIKIDSNKILLTWVNFVQAAKLLTNGKEKNILQLAVQYISNGGIDQSVIAADFDKDYFDKE